MSVFSKLRNKIDYCAKVVLVVGVVVVDVVALVVVVAVVGDFVVVVG